MEAHRTRPPIRARTSRPTGRGDHDYRQTRDRHADDLRDHLQYAIGLELTTIPAYLCALYSIVPGANTAACEVIQSVVLEEMLRMALAANILNAVGGTPATRPADGGPSPVPVYPATVPFIDALPVIHLRAFSPAAIDEFIAIERPAATRGPRRPPGTATARSARSTPRSRPGCARSARPRYSGRDARRERAASSSTENYYGGAGTLIEVTDLESALAAIGEIVREGEGVPRRALGQTAHEHLLSGARTPGRLGAPYDVDDMDRLPFGRTMHSPTPASPRSAPGATTGPTSSPETCPRATSCRWTGARSSRWRRTRPRTPTTAPGPTSP